MTREKEILSNLVVFSKYAKYIKEIGRRETWDEIVDRYTVMMVNKYPELKKEIFDNVSYIQQKKVLPSMRALQFAGAAMEVNNARGYNCCYLPIDSIHAFSETMFLLLGGTGVGYSVQQHHIAQLPTITVPTKMRRFLIQDDIMGWADAVKALMKAYLAGGSLPVFDFRAIREKGAELITAGGKAPGPDPLKMCLFEIQRVLMRKMDGEKLTSLECHDILCYIANAVLAGGIRRAAMISLFTHTDTDMLECKFGEWWELNEQRGRANNSAILERHDITEEEFKQLWHKIEISNSGEPGFYFTNDKDWGTNPCCEVALRPYQFCNLCEINADNIVDQNDLNERARVASFFGTLQAGFTDFHYLRPIWKRTTEKDALIGIGMTGIASGAVLDLNLTETTEIIEQENNRIAIIIGINTAARQTVVKPSGTTSLVVGSSSGIHGWHDDFIIRTIRFNKNEEVAIYLMKNHPELMEDDELRSTVTCFRVPMKAPKGAITRSETAIELLERVKKFSNEWIKPGHKDGVNTHNVSATISIDKNAMYDANYGIAFLDFSKDESSKTVWAQVDEWQKVGEWMWENRDVYNGLSVMPKDNGSYIQAPFESCTEEEYERRLALLQDIDFTKIHEEDDKTTLTESNACAGGACEVS